MKFSIFGILPVVLVFSACESMKAPISGDGSFDPLRRPGSGVSNVTEKTNSEFSVGQFVSASIPNTAFFKKRPKGNEDADQLLAVGTNMKIVSSEASYVKIELDSGEIGWVPSVMVSAASANEVPIDGAYQVYPPLPAGTEQALPLVDLSALPPSDAIPTIIDPTAVTPTLENPGQVVAPSQVVTPITPPSVPPVAAPQEAGQKAKEQLQKITPPSQ